MAMVGNLKPILYLDVDGVLNALGSNRVQGDYVISEGTWGSADGITRTPFGTKERVHRLMEAFDIVWATAWRGSAHPHFREHLELPDESFPHVDYIDLKLTEIVKHCKERPWAWVDDDAKWELGRLHEAFGSFDNTLIIVPDPSVGLTDEHVEQLLAFAEGLS